jgi:hypothetical protein
MTNVKIIFDSALCNNKKKRKFEYCLFISGVLVLCDMSDFNAPLSNIRGVFVYVNFIYLQKRFNI